MRTEFFFLKILFIYLTEIETASERGNTSRGSGRGRSRLTTQEPDVGLDPRTWGSIPERGAQSQNLGLDPRMPGPRPEPKADA